MVEPSSTPVQTDQSLMDTTPYGAGPNDSITDTSEAAAVTHHVATVGGRAIPYTARAGHLVTVDASNAQPSAKFFYVAFTADGIAPVGRPVTFFYNGGPGSSAVFVLLGSFAPRRIKTSLPSFTPPAPYTIEDNPDSLIDRSDLVFIDPVGTGYSAAIAPNKNRGFWGVDEDALDQAVHQALPHRVRPLELAQVPVRRILRHAPQLRARLAAARGRRRPQRHHAAVLDPRLFADRQCGRPAAHARGRCLVPQKGRLAAASWSVPDLCAAYGSPPRCGPPHPTDVTCAPSRGARTRGAGTRRARRPGMTTRARWRPQRRPRPLPA